MARVPLEERRADLVLQAAHLHAQRGLRHVQSLCRAPEVQLLCDGYEVAQLAEFHSGRIWVEDCRFVSNKLRAKRY
jgi:hypothetical protein